MASTRPRLKGRPISKVQPELPVHLPAKGDPVDPLTPLQRKRTPAEEDERARHMALLMPLSARCTGCGSEPVSPGTNTATERGRKT
ncbi:hypothetical protein PAL_GLEAN10012569 [Pteropus alecto]|uniref:Uncharacterized protein n=1 Tax=Pteropus alecto TaxID=9402 RepID=L5K6G7_PTEAL|nr:hypothetical protein PAL_GLEAN10012569 [Pteropus alecto]